MVEMVKSGEVSAGLALDEIRAAKGNDAVAIERLETAVTKARSEGKIRATAKHVERPKVEVVSSPTGHPAYIAALRWAVGALKTAGYDDAAALIKREIA